MGPSRGFDPAYDGREMAARRYRPRPIDTRGILLSEELARLTERLSKNAHEVWARQRLADGWTYGPRRDDRLKHHPGLVPYEELSEGEKEYDRGTVIETLKAIGALGFRILPPDPREEP
jgi:hypothetical protein